MDGFAIKTKYYVSSPQTFNNGVWCYNIWDAHTKSWVLLLDDPDLNAIKIYCKKLNQDYKLYSLEILDYCEYEEM